MIERKYSVWKKDFSVIIKRERNTLYNKTKEFVMTKEEFYKNLENKIGTMLSSGNVATFDAGLKDLPLPEEEKESKSED